MIDAKTAPPKSKLRQQGKTVIVVLAILALSWVAWRGWIVWVRLTTPRVKTADIERSIKESLAIGSSRKEVEAWIGRQALIDGHSDYKTRRGQEAIEAFILDAGPPPDSCVDIRILFFFDATNRLEEFKVKYEGRFESRSD